AAAGCAASTRGARCGRTSSVQAASGFRTTTPAPPTSIPRPFPPRVDQLSEDVLLNPPRVEPGSQPNGGNHGEPKRTVAPERLPDGRGSSRGGVAVAGERPDCGDESGALRAPGSHGRAGGVRFGVAGRQPIAASGGRRPTGRGARPRG